MGITGSFIGSLTSALPTPASGLERSQAAVMDLVGSVLKRGSVPAAEGGDPFQPGPGPAPVAVGGPGSFQDLTLPADLLAIVEPVFAQFDIRIEVTKKEHMVLKSCSMHVATDGNFKAYLLHFDPKVLEDGQQASGVLTVGYLFGPGETIRILSKGCYDPDPAFDFTWGIWNNQGIAAEYIGWRDIGRLEGLETGKRPDFLRLKFKLPETVKRRGSPALARLLDDPVYFKSLVDLIATTANATGPGVNEFFNGQLIGALPENMRQEKADWGGSYKTAARDLLQWTESKGNHPTRNGYTCTGAVLETFLDGQGEDGCKLICAACERFNLITDAKALAALKKKFLKEADQ